jgi:hypothetical protein
MYTVNLAALRTVTTARITMHILRLYVYIVAYVAVVVTNLCIRRLSSARMSGIAG